MRPVALILILLGACTTYPDDCNRRALHERRTVERLIVETQDNLARGYGYEIVESNWNTGFGWCSGGVWNNNVAFCASNTIPSYQRIPVAIDPAAERRKLDSLIQRHKALVEATAECQPV